MTATSHITTPAGACPRPADGVTLVAGKNRTRLVDPAGRTLHVLNGMALALWELCDGETTVSEMVAAACSLFEGDEDAVRRDIEGALALFTQAGLLVWEPPP